MDKGIAHINYSICMACGICVQACPFSCLELNNTRVDSSHNAYPSLLPDQKCVGCGICMNACPVSCISIYV